MREFNAKITYSEVNCSDSSVGSYNKYFILDSVSKLEVGNYRPISLLSNINKLLEKIIHERTSSFLEKYNCLYKYQFGFRKKHSINHALIEITEKSEKH